MKKKPMVLTLVREDVLAMASHNCYELGIGEAIISEFGGASFGRRYLFSFCAKDFERVTGFKLKPGEQCKVTISVKKVK